MQYTVRQMARMAGVSVRTLHYYDEIGLLKPAAVGRNGYRYYTEKELLKLQQVIFFRELDFELSRIGRIFDAPGFDAAEVLEDQKALLALKRERLGKQIRLIDKTIKNMKDDRQDKVTDRDLEETFSDGKYEEYKKEAQEKWGKDTVRRSENILKGMDKEQFEALKREGEEINQALGAFVGKDPKSAEVQQMIGRHYDYIIQFYDPSWPLLDIYRGLGKMYVEDPRFAANYTKYHPDMPQFMREAMEAFCDAKKK